ncbi:unnamed protein product, partial [Tenebrio molitor]
GVVAEVGYVPNTQRGRFKYFQKLEFIKRNKLLSIHKKCSQVVAFSLLQTQVVSSVAKKKKIDFIVVEMLFQKMNCEWVNVKIFARVTASAAS